jgi:hypothetical protein
MRSKSNRPVGMMRVVHRLLSIGHGQIKSSGGVVKERNSYFTLYDFDKYYYRKH